MAFGVSKLPKKQAGRYDYLTAPGQPPVKTKPAKKVKLPAPPPESSGGKQGVISVAKPKTPPPPLPNIPTFGAGASGSARTTVPNPNPTPDPAEFRATGGIAGPATAASAQVAPASGSNYQPTGTDPVGGFAGSHYTTGQLGTLFQQPGILAEDVLKSMGMGTNRQLLGQYGQVAQYAPALAELLASQTGNTSLESGVNTMADYMKNMATVGGRGLDSRELLNMILNPTQGGDLYDMLNAVDPDTGLQITPAQQYSVMQPYVQTAMSGSTPLHQDAQGAAMTRALADFQGQVARGQVPAGTSFYNYLRTKGLLG